MGSRSSRARQIAVVVTVLLAAACAAPSAMATIGYSVRSDADDILYQIHLESGAILPIGSGVGFGDVEGLAFSPSGTLYGTDDTSDQLITVDTATGAGTAVGPFGVPVVDMGLDFGCETNPMMSTDAPAPLNAYRLDAATGAATLLGPQGIEVTGLGSIGDKIFGITGDGTNRLVRMDAKTGNAIDIGPTGINLNDGGAAGAPDGTLWGIADDNGAIFTLDKQTGAATVVSNAGGSGFESLAIPEPPCAPPLEEAEVIPVATITGGPADKTRRRVATFTFGSEPARLLAGFQCSLDGGPFASCTSPHVVRVGKGRHTFAVRAVAGSGAVGQPATDDWKRQKRKKRKN